jgi:hypothetical protein
MWKKLTDVEGGKPKRERGKEGKREREKEEAR